MNCIISFEKPPTIIPNYYSNLRRFDMAVWIRYKIMDGTISISDLMNKIHRNSNLCDYCNSYKKNNINNSNLIIKSIWIPHYFCHTCNYCIKFNHNKIYKHLLLNKNHCKQEYATIRYICFNIHIYIHTYIYPY